MRGCLVLAGPAFLAAGLLLIATRLYETSVPSSPEDVDARTIFKKDDNHARLSGIDLDWEQRVLAAYEGVNDVSFHERDPRVVTDLAGPDEALARADELAHGFVKLSLPAPLSSGRSFLYRAFRTNPKGERVGEGTDTGTLIFAPVEGTGGALWVATEPVSGATAPEAQAALARTAHTGELLPLLEVNSDPALAEAFARGGERRPLPRRAFALEVKPRPRARRVETWVPAVAKGLEQRKLWVALPETPAAAPAGPFQGVFYKMPASEFGALDTYLERRRGKWRVDRPGMLVVGTPASYQARMGWERFSRSGALLAFAGAALTVVLFAGARGARAAR